jgi:phosphocarrier protein HPr
VSGSPERPFAVLTIVNRKGLHARASAKFVKCAETFNANIRVSRESSTVGGTSIMGLMMLGASQGTTIRLDADGPDAPEAVEALSALVIDGFGEDK